LRDCSLRPWPLNAGQKSVSAAKFEDLKQHPRIVERDWSSWNSRRLPMSAQFCPWMTRTSF